MERRRKDFFLHIIFSDFHMEHFIAKNKKKGEIPRKERKN